MDFDPPSGRITTDRGELQVNLKGADDSSSYSLYHVSGGECVAGMAQTSVTWKGKPLVSGPSGGYVYFFSADGSDFGKARKIYAKSEAPGNLVIGGRSARPRSVTLVDVSPLGNATLESLSWAPRGGGIEISISPTLQAYWVQVDW